MGKSLKEVEADFLTKMTQKNKQKEQKRKHQQRELMISNIALVLVLAFLLVWYFIG
jgi:hypothetical protein